MPKMTPPGKPVRASETHLADLILPSQANMNGTVFGGKILEMVDKAAGVAAMRHAGSPVVTVAMERVEFLVPIRLGSLVSVTAQVNYAGRTSMEVGVEVYSEDIKRGKKLRTNSCLVTMVAVDDYAKPCRVPRLIPESPEEKKRYAAAEARRDERIKRK